MRRRCSALNAPQPRLDQIDGRKVVPADACFGFRSVVVAQQFVRGNRGNDRPRRKGVPGGRHCSELTARVDIAVVIVEQPQGNSGPDDRIPFRVATDGPIRNLLPPRCRHQHRLVVRVVAQRKFVGEQIIRDLHRVCRQSGLRTQGFERRVLRDS